MNLTAAHVEEIFRDCLFVQDEPTDDMVTAQGIMMKAGFHPGRLATHRDEIRSMLAELPDTFQQEVGGGWSFLNGCMTANGELWTGLHETVDKLFILGIATQQAEYMPGHELWEAMPGGMPYVVLRLRGTE